MMRKAGLIILIITMVPVVLLSQVKQPERFEYSLTEDEGSFELSKIENNKLLLFRKNRQVTSEGRAWQFIKLDSALNKEWEKIFFIDEDLIYARHASIDEHLYFLFINGNKKTTNLELVDIQSENGPATKRTIKNVIPFNLTHFEASRHGILIGASYNYRPLILYYNLEQKKSKILPGFYHERSELVQIKVNEDQTVDVILSGTSFNTRNKKTLLIKKFDQEGNMIRDIILDNKEQKSLLFGRSCDLENGRQIVAGTYANRNSDYSRGIFLASINDYGEYNINFYNYGDLENFFSYMRAKREQRVLERVQRRKIRDRKLRFNYRLLMHDVIRSGDKYIMLGEAFYPRYKHPSNAEIAGFFTGPARNAEVIFDGYRYTHAVVAAFDESGKLLWDNSFEINDVKTFKLEQFVHVNVQDDKVVLLYVYENQIRSKIISDNEVLEGKTYSDIALKFESDKLAKSGNSIGEIVQWYDNNFYTHGIQEIKNLRDSDVGITRRVFYVNKVYYQ